jgi:hypothetical protein
MSQRALQLMKPLAQELRKTYATVTVEAEASHTALSLHELLSADFKSADCDNTFYAELKPTRAKKMCRGDGSVWGYKFEFEMVDSLTKNRPRSGTELGLYDWTPP